MQKRLDVQKVEYEEAIKRHIAFIDQVCTGTLEEASTHKSVNTHAGLLMTLTSDPLSP